MLLGVLQLTDAGVGVFCSSPVEVPSVRSLKFIRIVYGLTFQKCDMIMKVRSKHLFKDQTMGLGKDCYSNSDSMLTIKFAGDLFFVIETKSFSIILLILKI